MMYNVACGRRRCNAHNYGHRHGPPVGSSLHGWEWLGEVCESHSKLSLWVWRAELGLGQTNTSLLERENSASFFVGVTYRMCLVFCLKVEGERPIIWFVFFEQHVGVNGLPD